MALSFAFGGSSGQSYEELKRKRAFAEALQLRGAQGQPKSAIEGINSATQSILGALMSKKFGQQEESARAASQSHMTNVLGSLLGGGGDAGGYSPVAAPADPNSPRGIGDAAMAALGKPSNGFGDEGQAFKASLLAGGLPPHVVDGIMMNAKDESGFNPEAVGDNGAAFGILQWNGPRKEALKQFAASVGGNPADPAIQAQFTLHELKGSESAAYKSLMATGNAGEAGAAFVNEYERPAEAHRSRREAEYRGGGFSSPEIAIPQLVGLLNDPYASEADRSVLGMLLQQQFAQMQPPDPMDALALEKAQLEVDKLRNGTDGTTEYGLQPIVTQDDKGNYHLFQIPKDGSDPKEVKLPYGWTPKQQYLDTGTGFQAMPTQGTAAGDPVIIPKDVSGKAAATAVGEAAGAAQVALPGSSQAAADVAAQVEALKSDPYLPNMLGSVDSRLPNVSSDAARVQGKMNQLQGGAFLQARQLLKGGGAITDYEGAKAEAAYARLSAAQSPEDYKAALDEFNYYVQQGVKKLNDQAGMASPAAVSAPPPSSGTAQFRFNPATGKIEPVK